jgi:hypothetical protein
VGSDEGGVLASSEFDIPVSEQYPEEEVESLAGENPQVGVDSTDEVVISEGTEGDSDDQ